MKIVIVLAIYLQIILGASLVSAWSLENLRKNVGNFRVRHVTVYYMRAFLCIESENTAVSHRIPTLIEATWPENIIPIVPKIFPTTDGHAIHAGDCDKIHSAIGTSVDRKGRLWVIDNGSYLCPPKLLVYLILPWTGLMVGEPMQSVDDGRVTAILCDPVYSRNGSTRAFITLYEYDFMLVYYLKEERFGKIYFRDHRTRIDYPFQPTEIAWARTGKTVYVANNRTGELCSINVTKLKITSNESVSLVNISTKNKTIVKLTIILFNPQSKVPIKHIGTLLGPPRSLAADPKGALYYVLPRDGVVLRWNGHRPLKAEKHEILMFSGAEMTQIVFGARGSVWLVITQSGTIDDLEAGDHCVQILNHYTASPKYNDDSVESDYD